MEMSMTKEARIKARAYELYMAGGRNPGNELGNWLQAEKEIMQELQQQSKSGTAAVKT